MRKKVDPRIRMMIENGVKSKQRTMFVIVGDKGRDQVISWRIAAENDICSWIFSDDVSVFASRRLHLITSLKMF